MKITTIGIDLAKAVFQVHGVDVHGKTVLRKQLRRSEMAKFFANLEPCLIGIVLFVCREGAPALKKVIIFLVKTNNFIIMSCTKNSID